MTRWPNMQRRHAVRGRQISLLALMLIGAFQSTNAQASRDPVGAARIALQAARSSAMRAPREPLRDRADFVRRPGITDVRLAPDGRYVAFLRRGNVGSDVVIHDIARGVALVVATGVKRAEMAWSGDGRRLWVADEHGLALIDSLDERPSTRTRFVARRMYTWNRRRQQSLWLVDARAPDFAVVHEQITEADGNGERVQHRYLRVDAQGRTQVLLASTLPLRSALLTTQGAFAYTAAFDGAQYETVIREHGAAGVHELMRCTTIEACRLVGFNQAQSAVWVLSQHGEDKLALRRWQSRARRWETVHRDPEGVVDADDLLWSSAREEWLAVAYHGGHRRWYGSTPDTRSVLSALARALPNANIGLSVTTRGDLWLVQAQQADRADDAYYLYWSATGRLQPLLAETRPPAMTGAVPIHGATLHPLSYRARDGMLLHGYVALPTGRPLATVPLVAWLHGGPVARSYDRYDASVQFLVNRGIAVFLPNFRASSGYGLAYTLAARGDVGNGRVLTDIVEGMDFVLSQGIGDRDAQAVLGVSFGGYASLLAISHYPTRFRFAFAGAPPTEYGWIKQWQAEHDGEALRADGPPLTLQFPSFGFPYKDASWRRKMQQESPLAKLAALQVPAYIWAGERDDHVPLKSIVNYVGEARRLQKPVTLLIDPDGMHSPTNALGAEACLYLLETAIGRHFGDGHTPISPVSAVLLAFLRRNLRFDLDTAATRRARS